MRSVLVLPVFIFAVDIQVAQAVRGCHLPPQAPATFRAHGYLFRDALRGGHS